MVNPMIGIVVTGIGALVAVIGIAMGALFMTNDSFAITVIKCNPDLITNAEARALAEPQCNDDATVEIANKVCQSGNLGLYTASFTPQCSYDTGYEINKIFAPQKEVDPLELTVLFPAQNSLGSVPAALEAAGGPAASLYDTFEDCESFFALTGTALNLVPAVAGGGGFLAALQAVGEGLDAAFDANVQAQFDTLDEKLFVNAHLSVLARFNESISAATGGATQLDSSTLLPTFKFVLTQLRDGAQAGGDYVAGNSTQGVLSLIALVESKGSTAATAGGILAEVVAEGTTFATVTTVGTLSFPVNGPWASFDSTVLCQGMPCTVYEYIAGLIGGGSLSAEDTAQLSQAKAIFDGIQLAANVSTATLEGLAAVGTSSVSTAGVIATVQGSIDASLTIFPSVAAASTHPIIENIASGSPIKDINPSLGNLCAGAGVPDTCDHSTLFDIVIGQASISGDTDQAAQLTLVKSIIAQCNSQNITTWSSCILFSTGSGALSLDSTFARATADRIFSGLYDLDKVDESFLQGTGSAAVTALIAQCKEDNVNADAIALAQTTTPAGVALLAIGTVILVINLLVRNDKVKIIGGIGGLIALVGGIVALAGLLNLQASPIYASLGEPDPVPQPDNVTGFETAEGLTFALAFIGAALVGGLALLIGGLLLTPKGDASTDILGKA